MGLFGFISGLFGPLVRANVSLYIHDLRISGLFLAYLAHFWLSGMRSLVFLGLIWPIWAHFWPPGRRNVSPCIHDLCISGLFWPIWAHFWPPGRIVVFLGLFGIISGPWGGEQCWKFLSPGRPRRSDLGLGDLFSDVGSPGGRPEMAISLLL